MTVAVRTAPSGFYSAVSGILAEHSPIADDVIIQVHPVRPTAMEAIRATVVVL
jgi:hypothetical protein